MDKQTDYNLAQASLSKLNLGNSAGLIDNFVKYSQTLAIVMKSKSLNEVLDSIEHVVKQVFKVNKVSYLFQDKESLSMLEKEDAQVKVYKHPHGTF